MIIITGATQTQLDADGVVDVGQDRSVDIDIGG